MNNTEIKYLIWVQVAYKKEPRTAYLPEPILLKYRGIVKSRLWVLISICRFNACTTVCYLPCTCVSVWYLEINRYICQRICYCLRLSKQIIVNRFCYFKTPRCSWAVKFEMFYIFFCVPIYFFCNFLNGNNVYELDNRLR